jgi:hypothetical protein
MFLTAQIAKKFKIPTTYLMAGMTVLVAGIYTALQYNDPELLEKLTQFTATAFATSQAIWLIYNKLDKNLDLNKVL